VRAEVCWTCAGPKRARIRSLDWFPGMEVCWRRNRIGMNGRMDDVAARAGVGGSVSAHPINAGPAS
jgi:hypothetical protein